MLLTTRAQVRLFFALASTLSSLAVEAPAWASPAACVASQNESQDLLQAGKLVASQSKLVLCAGDQTCPQVVRVDCVRSLDELRPRIPTLVFAAVAADGSDTVEVKVYRDGELLVPSLTGAGVEMDPGEHKLRFVGPGDVAKETTLVVHEGEKSRRILIDFRPTRLPTAPSPVPAAVAIDAAALPERASTFPTSIVGWSLVGVGVVSIGVGSYFGLTAKSDNDNSKPLCGTSIGGSANQCLAQGTADRKDAASAATVSTVTFAAGAALAVGGALVLVLGPSRHRVAIAPTLGPGLAGLAGSFRW
jgi:hypothetical protein